MRSNERILKQLDRDYIRKVLYPRLLEGKPKGEPLESNECWIWPNCKANGRPIIGSTHGNLYVSRTLYKLLAPKLNLPPMGDANLKVQCGHLDCTNPKHYRLSLKSIREAAVAASFLSEI